MFSVWKPSILYENDQTRIGSTSFHKHFYEEPAQADVDDTGFVIILHQSGTHALNCTIHIPEIGIDRLNCERLTRFDLSVRSNNYNARLPKIKKFSLRRTFIKGKNLKLGLQCSKLNQAGHSPWAFVFTDPLKVNQPDSDKNPQEIQLCLHQFSQSDMTLSVPIRGYISQFHLLLVQIES